MKRIWRFALVAVCALLFPLSAVADTYNEVSGRGLLIRSNPDTAMVFIDGEEQGETPLTIPSLENGEYNVLLTKDGYKQRSFRVVIRPGSRIEALIDLEESRGELIAVIVRDSRAPQTLDFSPVLFINGSPAAEMPVALAVGWHTVSVEASGWESLSEMVYINEGETKNLQLILRPIGFPKIIEQSAAQEDTAPQYDPRVKFYPLTVISSVGGLFFVPSPESIPLYSFQVEVSLIGGKPLMGAALGKSSPFAVGGRFSFLERLEVALALNADIRFDEAAHGAFGVSGKWSFFQPGEGPAGLGASALLSYGAADRGPYSNFGMGTGLMIAAPLALRVVHERPLDLLVSPYLLWAGPKGYPQTPAPRIGISGGILYRHNDLFSGGLSARWDYAVSDAVPSSSKLSGSGPFMSALELKFTPSTFIISATGGFWSWKDENKKDDLGGFFGIGVGIIY